MIYVLYSNDYEVFLGGNYAPEREVLINPTEDILRTCDDLGVPMTLFCDLTCLWRYRELGYTEFPDAVEMQLKDAIHRGHDVQTHIHPHWFDTEITISKNGASKYNFDLSKFLLGNWNFPDGTSFYNFCIDIFKKAKLHLDELLQPIDPSYQCVAFRAGGYGIQPHTESIFKALFDSGYLIDSSIVPGMVLDSNVNRIDFSNVPQKGNYFVSPEHGINKASEAGVFEIPVMALRKGEANWLLVKAFLRKVAKYFFKSKKHQELGYPVQIKDTDGQKKTLLGQVSEQIDLIRNGWFMLELGTDIDIMLDATKKYINRYDNGNGDLFFSVSCHSKSLSPEILKSFRVFHRKLESTYGKQLKAITFQEAGRKLRSTGRQDR